MKKYETLKNEVAKALAEAEAKKKLFAKISEHITNEELILDTMSAKQLMHLLQFIELEKALNNSKYTLVHDSNYAKSRSKTAKTEMFSYIDSANMRALHIYSHDATLDIVFSSEEETLKKTAIAQQMSDYKFNFKEDSKTKDIKESTIKQVKFDDMINACKFAILILESSFEDLIAMCEEQAKEE